MSIHWETCPICYGGDVDCPDNCDATETQRREGHPIREANMRKNMYERIKSLEAAIKTLKEEGVITIDDAILAIEDLRDRQRGPRRA